MGNLHAVIQRDKGIAGAGQAGVNAVAAQDAAHVLSDRQYHMLLFRAIMADSPGVDAAVARVEHHNAAGAGLFGGGFAVSI